MSRQPSRSDLYADLGVPRDATQTVIDHAYRALVRRLHPDSRTASKGAEQGADDTALRRITAAYGVLGNRDRRAEYDRNNRIVATTPVEVHVHRSGQHLGEVPLVSAGPVYWYPQAVQDSHRTWVQVLGRNGGPSAGADVEVRALRAEVEQLTFARDSNRRIGMAVGIVMCQLQADERHAFGRLRDMSQNTNRKLRDIAEVVIEVGRI